MPVRLHTSPTKVVSKLAGARDESCGAALKRPELRGVPQIPFGVAGSKELYDSGASVGVRPRVANPLDVRIKAYFISGRFAKDAIAFRRLSRSIVTRANSVRRRLISICLALNCSLPWHPLRSRSIRLDPGCTRSAQPLPGCVIPCHRPARLHKSNRLLLELQRVTTSRCLRHLRVLWGVPVNCVHRCNPGQRRRRERGRAVS